MILNAFFLVGGGTIKGYVATTWACSVSPLSSAFLTFSTKYWKASCRNHRELYPNTRLWWTHSNEFQPQIPVMTSQAPPAEPLRSLWRPTYPDAIVWASIAATKYTKYQISNHVAHPMPICLKMLKGTMLRLKHPALQQVVKVDGLLPKLRTKQNDWHWMRNFPWLHQTLPATVLSSKPCKALSLQKSR